MDRLIGRFAVGVLASANREVVKRKAVNRRIRKEKKRSESVKVFDKEKEERTQPAEERKMEEVPSTPRVAKGWCHLFAAFPAVHQAGGGIHGWFFEEVRRKDEEKEEKKEEGKKGQRKPF